MGTFLVAPVMNREVVCANQNRNVLMLWNMPSHKLSRSPLPLATCVSFSGLRYHCQFHALKTAIQISLTSGRCCCFFFMTLSRNQTFRTLPNYGNVFILTQFVCEKMSLVSDEVLTETGNIQPQWPKIWMKDGNMGWGIRGHVQLSPYPLLKQLCMVDIKPSSIWDLKCIFPYPGLEVLAADMQPPLTQPYQIQSSVGTAVPSPPCSSSPTASPTAAACITQLRASSQLVRSILYLRCFIV